MSESHPQGTALRAVPHVTAHFEHCVPAPHIQVAGVWVREGLRSQAWMSLKSFPVTWKLDGVCETLNVSKRLIVKLFGRSPAGRSARTPTQVLHSQLYKSVCFEVQLQFNLSSENLWTKNGIRSESVCMSQLWAVYLVVPHTGITLTPCDIAPHTICISHSAHRNNNSAVLCHSRRVWFSQSIVLQWNIFILFSNLLYLNETYLLYYVCVDTTKEAFWDMTHNIKSQLNTGSNMLVEMKMSRFQVCRSYLRSTEQLGTADTEVKCSPQAVGHLMITNKVLCT